MRQSRILLVSVLFTFWSDQSFSYHRKAKKFQALDVSTCPTTALRGSGGYRLSLQTWINLSSSHMINGTIHDSFDRMSWNLCNGVNWFSGVLIDNSPKISYILMILRLLAEFYICLTLWNPSQRLPGFCELWPQTIVKFLGSEQSISNYASHLWQR